MEQVRQAGRQGQGRVLLRGISRRFHVGRVHGGVPDRGGLGQGREGRVDLGPVHPQRIVQVKKRYLRGA